MAKNIAVIGYSKEEHPDYYDLLEEMKEGDLIYIKSKRQYTSNQPLHLKAIGIVTDATVKPKALDDGTTASGIDVYWVKDFTESPEIIQAKPSPMSGSSVFEERSKTVIKEIVTHLYSHQ